MLLLIVLFGCQKNTTIKYSFFVAGHVYGSPEDDAPGLFPPFLNALKKMDQKMEMGFLTGDVIRFSDREIYWEKAMEEINSLNCEIHIAPGNHDVYTKAFFEKYINRYYYAFKKYDDLFIILNGNENWNIEGEQLYFLKETIQANEANRIFIFVHQLIWWEESPKHADCQPNSLMGKADTLTFHQILLPYFKNIQKPIYLFAGDVGVFKNKPSLCYHTDGNVTMIASGMGNYKTDNFLVVNVLENGEVFIGVVGLNCDTGSDCLGRLENY